MLVMPRLLRAAAGALVSCVLGLNGGASAAPAAAELTSYIVVYRDEAVPGDAAASLARAGGTLVHSYDAIGIALVTSSSATFRADVVGDSRVEAVSPSTAGGARVNPLFDDDAPVPSLPVPSAVRPLASRSALAEPTTNPNDFRARQWNMDQIKVPQAHAVTRGSRSVLVANIDTGIDPNHPDLAANIDYANSASCISGVAEQAPEKWLDDSGHGTHTSGIIAAASNGFGIDGVAPNVRLAVIKAGNANGIFYTHALVCAFMWAATHNVAVANNSYFADPYYVKCPNDPARGYEQAAYLEAERRAISYAQRRGVLVVSAMHNHSDDLANLDEDHQTMTDGVHGSRPVDRSCLAVPLQLPGVIGVGATGKDGRKALNSNYGMGIVDVVAPGGDAATQPLSDEGGGRVLSTWPASFACPANRRIPPVGDPIPATGVYCYLQGTSMATPHVTGVAALLISRAIERSRSGFNKDALLSLLANGLTDRKACPVYDDPNDPQLNPYLRRNSQNDGDVQRCTGTSFRNSWHGYGQINAHKAVNF